LLPVGLRIGEQTHRHTHVIMLTVLQLTFIVIFLNVPVDFWFVLLIYYCRSEDSRLKHLPGLCGGPDGVINREATVRAEDEQVGHGAIRGGLNWSGNQQIAIHQMLHQTRSYRTSTFRIGSDSLLPSENPLGRSTHCLKYNIKTSNDSEKHMQTHGLMGGIYEVRRWDGLRCNGIRTKFHKDWFSHLWMRTRSITYYPGICLEGNQE
jgi:hypothetical protein